MSQETEMDMLKRVVSDPRNPKSVKQAALNQLRVLEKAAGVEGKEYNSGEFSK